MVIKCYTDCTRLDYTVFLLLLLTIIGKLTATQHFRLNQSQNPELRWFLDSPCRWLPVPDGIPGFPASTKGWDANPRPQLSAASYPYPW